MPLPPEKEHKATVKKYADIQSNLRKNHKACRGCKANDACYSQKLCDQRQAVINNLKMGIPQLKRNYKEKNERQYDNTLKTRLEGALATWHKENRKKKFKF